MGAMFWVGVCSLLLTLGVVAGHMIFGSGRTTQAVRDNKTHIQRTLDDHSAQLLKIRDQNYQHEKEVEEHYRNTELHWTPQERPWMTVRFDKIDQRFDKSDARFDKLERMIRKEEK